MAEIGEGAGGTEGVEKRAGAERDQGGGVGVRGAPGAPRETPDPPPSHPPLVPAPLPPRSSSPVLPPSLPFERIGAVSRRLGRGRHTTRGAKLLRVASDALVVDTPGAGRPPLRASSRDLPAFFPEIRHLQELRGGRCRFADCTHTVEPGCAVKEGGDFARRPVYETLRAELLTIEAARKAKGMAATETVADKRIVQRARAAARSELRGFGAEKRGGGGGGKGKGKGKKKKK